MAEEEERLTVERSVTSLDLLPEEEEEETEGIGHSSSWFQQSRTRSDEPDSDVLMSPKSKSYEELRELAEMRAEALRNECETGLTRVRYLMTYMLLLSVMIMPAVGVCEWVLVESRRGNLERDWWKCLIHDNLELHYIDSDQSEELPGVLATMLYQSCLLAWAAVIVYQRSCIRMDWISSAIVNNLYTLLLICMPAYSAAWPAPTSITASLITMVFYLPRAHLFQQVPNPNKCGQARRFCLICLVLISLTAVANIVTLIFVCRAEAIRRKAVTAEKQFLAIQKNTYRKKSILQESVHNQDPDLEAPTPLHQSTENPRRTLSFSQNHTGIVDQTQDASSGVHRETESLLRTEGLSHRLCCANEKWHLPRSIVAGSLMSASYLTCTISRCILVIVAQRSFDQFTKAQALNLADIRVDDFSDDAIQILGGTTLVPAAPGISLGPSAAFLAFASIVRGYSGDDLANYRIAALLAVAALFVDAPAFAATLHATIQRNLYSFNIRYCVENYVLGRANDIYGFPSRDRAHTICLCLFVNFYSSCLHLLSIFFMAAATIRTFYINHRSFDDVVMPAPADQSQGSIHLLRTDDRTTFEYDLNAPLLFQQQRFSSFAAPAAPRNTTTSQPDDHHNSHRHTLASTTPNFRQRNNNNTTTPQRSFLFAGLRHHYTEPRYSAIIIRPRAQLNQDDDFPRAATGRFRSGSVPSAPMPSRNGTGNNSAYTAPTALISRLSDSSNNSAPPPE